jgi:hypothetical protein
MTTDIQYKLKGYGWASLFITNGSSYTEITISYLSNPLAELLTALICLSENKSQSETINFFDEPGAHSLVLTLKSDRTLQLEIYFSEEGGELNYVETAKKLVYSDIDSLDDLSHLVLVTVKDLLNDYGLKGYKEKWIEHDFPETLFLQLLKLKTTPDSF